MGKNSQDKLQDIIESAKFYFLNGKYDKAEEEFKKALKISPTNDEIYYHLGLVYESKNDIENALKMYQRTLEINPSNKLAKEHLNKLKME